MRIRHALETAEWRLPPERITWTSNSYAGPVENPWHESEYVHRSTPIRVLGVQLCINGGIFRDFTQKLAIATGAVEQKQELWSCRGSTRKQRYRLMLQVFMLQLWSAPVWMMRKKHVSKLHGSLHNTFKRYTRLPRYWGETDATYAQRQNKLLREIKAETELYDPDSLVLSRIYKFTGHVCRMGEYDQARQTCKVLRNKDRHWCRQQMEIIGHGATMVSSLHGVMSSCLTDTSDHRSWRDGGSTRSWNVVTASNVLGSLHVGRWCKAWLLRVSLFRISGIKF